MRKVVALIVAAMSISTLALASQPGDPIDCTDWVFLIPGLRCIVDAPPPCNTDFCKTFIARTPHQDMRDGSYGPEDRLGSPRVIDNDGYLYSLRRRFSSTCQNNGGSHDINNYRLEVVRSLAMGAAEEVIAYADDRCYDANPPFNLPTVDRIRPGRSYKQLQSSISGWCGNFEEEGYLLFDPVRGRLVVPLLSSKHFCSSGGAFWIMSIEGLTPLFDVIESYTPTPSALGVLVPEFPEGFRTSNRFDTYWGHVTQPLDLANAHPLLCNYPPVPPRAGDYLTITAPVPVPTPGNANYVLTSVTYQGQTRAGRKASGGRLTGRDASRLPACVIE